ncbi:MAG: hypothetical protein JW880_01640 [Candidatus Thermoplasmatota archaeon]|nr:hypothetical protein [Candidatus Thermoplasmatota archaeon]
MPDPSGGKLCPICDSPLQPGSRKCGFCGTDLSIFDTDLEASTGAPEPPPSAAEKPSIHAKVEEVLSKPAPAPEPRIVREVPEPAPEPIEPVVAEPVAAEPEPVKEPEPIVEQPAPVEYFECPQCGAHVETTASSCPKCGVLFAEEGADMFQCPACNTLVSVDAASCPGCGAIFVEPESEAAQEILLEETRAPAPERPEAAPSVERVAPRAAQKEPEPVEEKPSVVRGLFGKLRLGRKEKPSEREPEARPEPSPVPKAEGPRVSKRPEPRPVSTAPEAYEAPEVQQRPFAPAPAAAGAPPVKDKGKELARMVAEMKPLLALARERDVTIGESKDLIDEAAVAGRERQLDNAIDLVQKSKAVLMVRIDGHLGQTISQLSEDMKVAREFGGDISRAATYMQELARARAAKDIEAAFVYVDKVEKELVPITGRYNEARKKTASAKQFISDCEMFLVDTKDARRLLVEANKAFEAKDFDRLDTHLKSINETLYKAIPARMNEEMVKAREDLLEAKVKGVNITPMLTVLKSATSLMKSGDYSQAIREMREFKTMMKKPA